MKTPGICFVCEQECFEVLNYHINGPYEGQPSKLGKPHDDAIRLTMVQVDGSQIQISVHRDCIESVDLAAMWHQIMERLTYDDKNRRALGGPELAAEEQAQFNKHSLQFYDNRPLGILAAERWQDVSAE